MSAKKYLATKNGKSIPPLKPVPPGQLNCCAASRLLRRGFSCSREEQGKTSPFNRTSSCPAISSWSERESASPEVLVFSSPPPLKIFRSPHHLHPPIKKAPFHNLSPSAPPPHCKNPPHNLSPLSLLKPPFHHLNYPLTPPPPPSQTTAHTPPPPTLETPTASPSHHSPPCHRRRDTRHNISTISTKQ